MSGGAARPGAGRRVPSRGLECAARGVAGHRGVDRRRPRFRRRAAGRAGAADRRRFVGGHSLHRRVGGAWSSSISFCSPARTTAVRCQVIYPIARGSAPVVVLVFGAIALNENVSAGRRRRRARHRRRGAPRWVGRFSFPFRKGKRHTPSGRLVWAGDRGSSLRRTRLWIPRRLSMPTRLRTSPSSLRRALRVYPAVTRTRPDLEPADAPSPPRPPSAPSSWCSPRSGSRRRRRWPR